MSSVLLASMRTDIPPQMLFFQDHGFTCILAIVQRCGTEEVLRRFLNHFISTIKNEISAGHDMAIKGYLASIQAIFLRIGERLENAFFTETYQIVDSYFQKFQFVNSDGIALLGSLAMGSPSFIEKVFETTWKYTEFALSQTSDGEIKAALTAIGDFSKAVPHLITPHLPKLITYVENSIKDSNFSRHVKLYTYSVIGDIAIGLNTASLPYLENFLSLLNLGSMAVLELSSSPEPENLEYADLLKEKIIEGYTCTLNIIQDYPSDQFFRQCIPGIVSFIEQSTHINLHPTIDYIRLCLNLIGDIVAAYSENAKLCLNSPGTRNLITCLQRYDGAENQNTLRYIHNIETKFLRY